jgi:acyl-CoA synthetase
VRPGGVPAAAGHRAEVGALDLDGLREHLRARGVSPENWPERVEIVDELPRASGGKVAKAELRKRLAAA